MRWFVLDKNMPGFEQPKPYSQEEQEEIKNELERQADEKRKNIQPEEKTPEELEPELREEKEETKGETVSEKPPEEPKEKTEEKAEKTEEQVLTEARENFARAQLDKAETLKTVKKFKGESVFNSVKPTDAEIIAKYDKQTKELADKGIAATLMTEEEKQAYYDALTRKKDFEEFFRTKGLNEEQADKIYEDVIAHNKAKEQYQEALKDMRVGMYEKALDEIEKLGLPEEKANELMRQKMEKIAKTTVVDEANNLYDKKNAVRLELKGEANVFEKIWNKAGKGAEWYRKQKTWKKLAISGAVFATGFGAGAAMGVSGGALVSGLFVGRFGQRIFGGLASSVGLEALIKQSQEKQAEKRTFKKFGDKLSELIKTNDKSLDERLLELTGKKESEKTRRYILAGAFGAMIASGLLGRAIRWGIQETGVGSSVKEIIKYTLEKFGVGKPPLPELAISHGPGYVPHEALEYSAYEPPPGPEYPAYEVLRGGPQIASKGDSVWKVIGRQLSDRYGEKFNGLDEARKTYVIDSMKDKVAANLEKYGLANIDQIQAGKTYDFLPGSQSEIEAAFGEAEAIKENIASQIAEHNGAIEDWVKNHPGESLTSEKVDEILFGKKIGPALEEAEKGLNRPLAEMNPDEALPSKEELPGEYVQESKITKEELPGEYVEESKVEKVMQSEKNLPSESRNVQTYEQMSEKQLAGQMLNNEISQVRTIGYAQPEYQVVRNIKVNVFLQEFPPRHQAWDAWRVNPHYRHYSPYEFRHHLRAAEIIRSHHPGFHNRGIGHMTVGRFFQTFGPRRFPIPLPPPPPFGRPF